MKNPLTVLAGSGRPILSKSGKDYIQRGRQVQAAGGDLLAGATATTLTETTAYLTNPGIGFQGYTATSSIYPQTVEYRRGNPDAGQGNFDWADLNPSQGTYNWSYVDNFLTAVASAGRRGSFRVTTMLGDGFGGSNVPSWVISQGVTVLSDGQPEYHAYPYQYWWGQFVDALAARYDGDSRIAFIDISGYGKFNEWQPYSGTDGSNEEPLSPVTSMDGRCRRHLIHCFVGGAGTLTSLAADGSTTRNDSYTHPGFAKTQLVMPYGGQYNSTRYVLANYPNVGFRNDALGTSDASAATLNQIGFGIADLSKRAPLMFEPIHDWNETTHAATAKQTLRDMGATFVHDNGLANDATITDMLLRLGYRYLCSKVRTLPNVPRGSLMLAETTWTNTGYAKSYPRMGQNFRVALALIDSSGTVQASWGTEHQVASWLPGVQQVALDIVSVPSTIPAGAYTLHVGIVDTGTGTRIQLPLTTSRNDNWYPGGSIALT